MGKKRIEWKENYAGSSANDFTKAEQANFLDEDLSNVTRENLQNVVDHPEDELSPRVRVKFSLLELPREKVFEPLGFQTLLDRAKGTIELAKSVDNEKHEVVSNCKKQIKLFNSPSFKFLKVSDYGTTGVSGKRKFGTDKSLRGTKNKFASMVYDLGAGDQADTGAGGHGLGKLANIACSNLGVAFFSTVNKEDSFCSGVALNYVTENEDGDRLEKMAYFVRRDDVTDREYDSNETMTLLTQEEACDLCPELFKREEIGTDVIVLEPRIYNSDIDNDWKQNVLSN